MAKLRGPAKGRPDQDLARKFAALRSSIPTPALIVPRFSLIVLRYPVVPGARPSALSTHRLSVITLRELALDGLDCYLRRK